MARKDVLKGLMSGIPSPPPAPASGPASAPASGPASGPARSTRGAIGAVSQSIADLKARSVAEIDPFLIDAGGVQDRVETVDAEDDRLRESIAEHGQQVPVLVRPHPQTPGRYQIVYGRRRVLAMRDLNLPVKALIRDLDDRELVLAQGQENTARRDLSFIEKVNFARQLDEMGYDRKVMIDALSVDKTVISRMLSLAARIPPDLIATIGSAPSVGRDRWTALADLLPDSGADVQELAGVINAFATSERSDDRFIAVLNYLEWLKKKRAEAAGAPARAKIPPRRIAAPDGMPLAQARLTARSCTLSLRGAPVSAGFAPWLLDNLPALFAEWQARASTPDDSN